MMKESNYTIDLVQNQWCGVLGMAIAPGKNYMGAIQKRDLKKDIQRITKYYKMDKLVCLIEEEQMRWLGISKQFEECNNVGLSYEHFPIEDMDVPENINTFKQLVKKIVDQYLKKGKRVLIHCQGGNGRTGLFVACCFIYQGYTPQEAIEKVRKIRRYAVETSQQQNFVRNIKF